MCKGAGFGFMIPVAYTTFNHYFVEKRVIMMSVAQTLIGFGTMIYPILVQHLMDMYGFRGTMAIIAAINGHVILSMITMHPIEWNYKVVKVHLVEEGKPCNCQFCVLAHFTALSSYIFPFSGFFFLLFFSSYVFSRQ